MWKGICPICEVIIENEVELRHCPVCKHHLSMKEDKDINKDLIKKAKDAYYNSSEPIMSDWAYDQLIAEVGEESVGAPVTGKIDRVKIPGRAMKSLEKVHSAQEIIDKLGRCDLYASIKCDGLSTRLVYENGKLTSANTRGDGVEGGDVTEHIKYFQNVPLTIDRTDRYVVDGEAVILFNDFENIRDKYNLKNPRNAAAGALSTKDTSLAKNYKLSFIAWDVIEGSKEQYQWTMEECESLGLTVVPAFCIDCTKVEIENLDNINENLFNIASEKGIPIDGVVWAIIDTEERRNKGETDHHFLGSVAWKRENITYDTELVDIELSLGRTGQLTPVAIYKDIDTGSAILNRASLHNVSVMTETLGKYPFVGQKVKVFQANEIIPQIGWAESSDEAPKQKKELIKCTCCPVCGGGLEIKDNDGVITIWCENPECEGKLANRIDHYAGKKGLDIKGISGQTIEKLMDWGWLDSISDLYLLNTHAVEWKKKAGFGEASVNKILDAIEGSKKCELWRFISALGIPLVGTRIAKEIVKYYSTWNDFMNAIGGKWSDLDGFGPEMEKAINDFDYAEAKVIAEQYLDFKAEEPVKATSSGNVAGKVFVITGKLSKSRALVQVDIEAAGAKMGSSVTSKTNYLVCNAPENTTKYNKAIQLNIPIITEDELKEILGK